MKKLLLLVMVSLMIFALTACSNISSASTSASSADESIVSTGESANTSEQAGEAQEEMEQETTSESAEEVSKSLVVYFSWSGNTKEIAEEVAKQTGSDIFEIVPVNAYSTDYNTVIDDAKAEQNNNARPEIEGTIENFDEYDVVYFGFPNWWGDMPMIMYTFLDTYDFSGKTICEFVSSSSSGLSNTINSLKEAEPDATVTDGLSITGATSEGAESKVNDWLSAIGQQ